MGETVLVTRDVIQGARLVQELDARDLPLTAAFWTHESSLDTWRLVVAVPMREDTSPRAAYRRIQSVILDLDLGLSLDRVALIPDSDPLIKDLRDLVKTGSTDVVEIPIGSGEIAGEAVDKVYAYRLEALRYGKEVLGALQRIQPAGAVLRRADGLDFSSSSEPDFILDNGDQTVLVEAKALSRPLDLRDVRHSADLMDRAWGYYRKSAAWLIVSRTDFTSDALNWISDSTGRTEAVRRMRLVKWASRSDDPQLREVLVYLLDRI